MKKTVLVLSLLSINATTLLGGNQDDTSPSLPELPSPITAPQGELDTLLAASQSKADILKAAATTLEERCEKAPDTSAKRLRRKSVKLGRDRANSIEKLREQAKNGTISDSDKTLLEVLTRVERPKHSTEYTEDNFDF